MSSTFDANRKRTIQQNVKLQRLLREGISQDEIESLLPIVNDCSSVLI